MFATNTVTLVRLAHRYDTHFDIRMMTRDALVMDRLWFRRFIARDDLMPAPAAPPPRPCVYESRHIRQERSNHAQRRQILRRRFVQELAR